MPPDRSTMLEVVRAGLHPHCLVKGLRERDYCLPHTLNALIPVVTVLGMQVSHSLVWYPYLLKSGLTSLYG